MIEKTPAKAGVVILLYIKISCIRMGKDDGRDARFRFHHEAFRQADADILRLQQLEQLLLVFEVRTGRIAETEALPLVFRGKTVTHRKVYTVREAPLVADFLVDAFCKALGKLQCRRLQGMALKELAILLQCTCLL